MQWDENEVKERILEIENDPRVMLKVPIKLVDPDPLVVDAKRSLTRPDDRSSWLFKNEGVVSNAGALQIRVAPNNVDRSLRLFDTIIKVFRARGHHFERSTVDFRKQKFDISITEKLKKLDEYKKDPPIFFALKFIELTPDLKFTILKTCLLKTGFRAQWRK